MKRPSLKKLQVQVDAWNREHAVGTAVTVKRDGGGVEAVKTRSEAFVVGGHTAVIMLDGISGAYRLDRVTVAAQQRADQAVSA